MPPLPGSRLVYDPRSGRYRDARGRYVNAAAVRADIDAAIGEAQGRMRALAERLRARTISVRQWEVAMRREVKIVHGWNAAAAVGGYHRMSPAVWGKTGALVKAQYRFLRGFARDVLAGRQRRDGTMLRRAAMYGDAGRASFEALRRVEMAERGFTEERSVLHPADHCAECVAEAARGWQPIGTIVPVGARTCLVNCHCTSEYRAA